ncbi:MAG: 1-acyl-sn-glycerol-3-phosphate acyltransferase [Acidobacteria bacterium]|nr:1-acyl-sn-glycerol-3-phosphate acyltransferase [Acidobacteriota bacterium]
MKVFAFLHSIVAIPLIYLYTMVMATISLSVSFFDRDGRRQHWCAHTWCRLIAATAGMRVSVDGIENLPEPGVPVVYMANHQSYMDIPVLFGFLPVQFRIIAKESLFKVPFMGWHLTRAGNIPINRTNRREAMRSIARAAERIREGTSVVVFPEGTRSRDGSLQAFKAGSFKLAMTAGVPIVPLTIIGTCRVLERDSLLIRPGRVALRIHPAIPSAGMRSAEIESLMDAVWIEMAEPLIPLGLAPSEPLHLPAPATETAS